MNAGRGQDGLLSPDSVLHRAAERLAQQFAGMVSEETVERVVFESYAALARTANVSTHLPRVAEKFARDRLVALAQSRGLIAKPVPEILYVCVLDGIRAVRDEIQQHVEQLLTELTPGLTAARS